ncbi:hypothetical protein D3C84_884950 [compost metagenome]
MAAMNFLIMLSSTSLTRVTVGLIWNMLTESITRSSRSGRRMFSVMRSFLLSARLSSSRARMISLTK